MMGAMRWRRGLGLVALLVGVAWSEVHAAVVHVAVAANFSVPMRLIAQDFERATGHSLVLSFGSSGGFFAQIRHGAPFHVLLAADEEIPRRLAQAGLAVASTRFTYAVGRLALWSRTPGLVDGQGQVLRDGRFARLAVANPKLAPYGAAAMQTLAALGVAAQVQPKLVFGESVAQAHHFVASGNAELGFVALSQLGPAGTLPIGSVWIVPQSLHAPIRQDAVLLMRGQGDAAASALLAHLRSESALRVMKAFGYGL